MTVTPMVHDDTIFICSLAVHQFFGILGLCYFVIGAVWVVCLAVYHRDLLHLQFWIGGVALICTCLSL